jgi:hypothetical protein
LDAAAEEALLGEFFDEDDLGGDEDGGLAFLVGDGNVDEGLGVVAVATLEAQAAFGHVLADDDVVAALGMTDAGGVADFDARMLAAVGAREGGLIGGGGGSGRRHGKDGGARLALRLVAVFGRSNGGGRSIGLRQGHMVLQGTVRLRVERRRVGGRNGWRGGKSCRLRNRIGRRRGTLCGKGHG